MRKFFRTLAWIAIVFVVLFDVALIIGWFVPKEHTVSRTLTLQKSPPSAVWRVLSDRVHEPEWRPDVKSVEQLPNRGGLELWRDHYKNGMTMTLENSQFFPPTYLVRTIADENAPFAGSWEFEIRQAGNGSTVKITERGRVRNPFYRFVGKYIIGQTRSLDDYLGALAKRMGESPKIS